MRTLRSPVRGRALPFSTLSVLLAGLCACSAHATGAETLATDIRATLASIQPTAARDVTDRSRQEALHAAYTLRDFAPLWSRNGSPTRQAILLMRALRTAELYGLRAQDYVGGLGGDPSVIPIASSERRNVREPESDVALSAAALKLLTDVHFGRVAPAAAGFNLQSTRPPLALDNLLLELAAPTTLKG
jgi:murein L,D-transpeptidase YcbB/YkuD